MPLKPKKITENPYDLKNDQITFKTYKMTEIFEIYLDGNI